MSHPSVNEDDSRIQEDRSIQSSADEDGWLVRGLVFGLRFFLVLVVAFARAVLIVAGENVPDTLFHQVIPAAVASVPSSSPQVRSSNLGSSEALSTGTVDTPQQGYYIVFIGRQVGYTTSSTLMASMVHGIPNNQSKKFSTFEEAIQAYTSAVQHGNVRQVRTVIQPSGHVEFIYEYLGFPAGIRNLDDPHMTPMPLTPANFPPDLLPPTPCNSETCADSRDGTVSTRVSSVLTLLSSAESSGLVMPGGHPMVDALEESADTVIINTTSTHPSIAIGMPSTMTILSLDSDEGSANSSIIVNNSVTSVHSAHSSDIYYTDKKYDIAFATLVAEEDRRVVGGETASIEAAVQTE